MGVDHILVYSKNSELVNATGIEPVSYRIYRYALPLSYALSRDGGFEPRLPSLEGRSTRHFGVLSYIPWIIVIDYIPTGIKAAAKITPCI